MACGKNQGCLNITNNVYPGLQVEINSSINNITTNINEIVSELGSLVIPEDYLGTKVTEELDEICSNLSNDVLEVNSVGRSINNFISLKKEEHQKHYRQWQEEQRRLQVEHENNEKED